MFKLSDGMKIWLVNPFDRLPMEQKLPARYGYLVDVLLERGHEVTWWTSSFCHAAKKARKQVPSERENLEVVYLNCSPYEKNIGFPRLWNSYQYGREFEKEARKRDAPDIIFASFPPIDSADTATKVAKHFSVPVILDVQDIWPDVFLFPFPSKIRPLAKPLLAPFYLRSIRAFKQASAITGVSNEYVQYGLKYVPSSPPPHQTTYLGYDRNSFEIADSWSDQPGDPTPETRFEKSGHRWVTFAGTVGHTYDIIAIVEAARELENHSSDLNVAFQIIGDGPLLGAAKELAQKYELKNITFRGRLPFDQVVSVLKRSAVGLNSYAAGAPQSFTNKICEYLGAGLPVVNSIPGELAQLVDRENLGENYQAGEVSSLSEAIKSLLGKDLTSVSERSLEFARLNFDRAKTYPHLAQFIEELVN